MSTTALGASADDFAYFRFDRDRGHLLDVHVRYGNDDLATSWDVHECLFVASIAALHDFYPPSAVADWIDDNLDYLDRLPSLDVESIGIPDQHELRGRLRDAPRDGSRTASWEFGVIDDLIAFEESIVFESDARRFWRTMALGDDLEWNLLLQSAERIISALAGHDRSESLAVYAQAGDTILDGAPPFFAEIEQLAGVAVQSHFRDAPNRDDLDLTPTSDPGGEISNTTMAVLGSRSGATLSRTTERTAQAVALVNEALSLILDEREMVALMTYAIEERDQSLLQLLTPHPRRRIRFGERIGDIELGLTSEERLGNEGPLTL